MQVDIRGSHVLSFGLGLTLAGLGGIVALSDPFGDDGDPFVYWPTLVGAALAVGAAAWIVYRRATKGAARGEAA